MLLRGLVGEVGRRGDGQEETGVVVARRWEGDGSWCHLAELEEVGGLGRELGGCRRTRGAETSTVPLPPTVTLRHFEFGGDLRQPTALVYC